MLTSPFPYFGSKRDAAPAIWAALGSVPNFVDATCGSAAVLWARPHLGKVETLNDAWGAIPNFLRAIRGAPEAVAEAASWPVDETMMHARHRWLVERMDDFFVERLMTNPEYFDPEIAGWWVWGQSIWIGSGWCATNHRNVDARQRPALSGGRKRPALGGHGGEVQSGYPKEGVGIFRGGMSRLPHLIGPNNVGKLGGPLPSLQGSDGSGVGYGRGVFASGRREDLVKYFGLLAARLRSPNNVRIICGDWARVCTPAVTTSHGLTGVLLDPPYGDAAKRTKKLYAHDSADVAPAMRAWAAEHGDNPHLRIVLCGYEGEHEELAAKGWRSTAWKARGGYGNQDGENTNAARERLWCSPHCLRGGEQQDLFAGAN